MINIYIVDSKKINITDDFYNHLPSRKLKKVQASTNELFIKEQLISQRLLNDILESDYGLDLATIEYVYNEQGKPYLKDLDLYFSVSHSNGVIAVGVNEAEFGIDLELVKAVPSKVITKVLTPNELNIYSTLNEKAKSEYFFKIWTKKEAIVKKQGTSIVFNANKIETDENIYTTSFKLGHKQYILSSTITDVKLIIKEKI